MPTKSAGDGSSLNDLDLSHAVDTPTIGKSSRNPYMIPNVNLSTSSATDPLSYQSRQFPNIRTKHTCPKEIGIPDAHAAR